MPIRIERCIGVSVAVRVLTPCLSVSLYRVLMYYRLMYHYLSKTDTIDSKSQVVSGPDTLSRNPELRKLTQLVRAVERRAGASAQVATRGAGSRA